MKWGGGEGDSAPIAPLRPPQTEVELTVSLPTMPWVEDDGKPQKLHIKQVATGIEEMAEGERTWAINYLLNSVQTAVLKALTEKGYIRGGS
ncbi:hypothetical protein FGG47_gp54 [Mycobacterium phage Rebeuca]|uniref:Uncharacterized protein n=1 Tax=Mycobacterium phage Rebeuca TaxID=2927991 RepID=J7KLY7_9CAUD|nr:hypothetical protein FGG47_gp54 [Mycobacterium phage Rebeuca]AFQ97349.1 hypothetical protein REBEUCA_41 [Mycobacterium phage Rebeuca]QLF84439.1 hypothetical protein SEA_TOPANGA_39 [Mycobacterium phage Topanga]